MKKKALALCAMTVGIFGVRDAMAVSFAATFTVNSTLDQNVPNNGLCTLREALIAANSNVTSADCQNKTGGAHDRIILPAGTFAITSSLGVSQNLTVTSTAGAIIVGGGFTTINVAAGVYFGLSGTTIQGSRRGAIFAGPNSSIYVENCVISGGRFFADGVSQSSGINVDNGAVANIFQTTFTDNRDGLKGSAVSVLPGGTAYFDYSTADNNHVLQYGGGIFNQGNFFCNNSTISGNYAGYYGGGVGTAPLSYSDFQNCTITNNRTGTTGLPFANVGSNIQVIGGTVYLAGTIVADPAPGAPGHNCAGTLLSNGKNLIGDMTTCTMTPNSDQVGVSNAFLAGLTNNGGPTRTHMPASNSGAVNNGPTNGSCPYDDQRGTVRSGVCDVGAVER